MAETTGRAEEASPNNSLERRLYGLVLAQFLVIAILWGALSNDYLTNTGMRGWVAANAPFLRILLNWDVGSILIGLSAGWTTLYLGKIVLAKTPVRVKEELQQDLAIVRQIMLLDGEEEELRQPERLEDPEEA